MSNEGEFSGEVNPERVRTDKLSIVKRSSSWRDQLDDRETAKIDHATCYAEQFSAAGIAGHSDLLLIAKLTRLLDQLQGG